MSATTTTQRARARRSSRSRGLVGLGARGGAAAAQRPRSRSCSMRGASTASRPPGARPLVQRGDRLTLRAELLDRPGRRAGRRAARRRLRAPRAGAHSAGRRATRAAHLQARATGRSSARERPARSRASSPSSAARAATRACEARTSRGSAAASSAATARPSSACCSARSQAFSSLSSPTSTLDGERLLLDPVGVREQILVGNPHADPIGELEPGLAAHRVQPVDEVEDAALAQRARRRGAVSSATVSPSSAATAQPSRPTSLDEHLVRLEDVPVDAEPAAVERLEAALLRARCARRASVAPSLGPSTGRFGFTRSSLASTSPNSTSLTRSSSAISSACGRAGPAPATTSRRSGWRSFRPRRRPRLAPELDDAPRPPPPRASSVSSTLAGSGQGARNTDSSSADEVPPQCSARNGITGEIDLQRGRERIPERRGARSGRSPRSAGASA